MTEYRVADLDVNKLRDNALTSIRLGIEDFGLTKAIEHREADPARALSSIRNLFAGVLLLLKYKIANSVDDSNEAAALIFNPPNETLPEPDGEGGIHWQPVGKFKPNTIDVGLIKKRLDSFDIHFEWEVIENLQQARNHIEHLHPKNGLGELSGLIAQLFPALRDFIQNELEEHPAEILETAWPIMLAHAEFYNEILKDCLAEWDLTGIPAPLLSVLKKCQCDECSSYLVRPDKLALDYGRTVEYNEEEFDYVCQECSNTQPMAELLISTLHIEHGVHPMDYVEPGIETCIWCNHSTFVVLEQKCYWCEDELDYKECSICEEPLGQMDQDNNGMCGYHAHTWEKMMRE